MSKKLERPPQLLAPLSSAALADLLENKGPPTCDRLPPVILLQKCPCGREWMTEGGTGPAAVRELRAVDACAEGERLSSIAPSPLE